MSSGDTACRVEAIDDQDDVEEFDGEEQASSDETAGLCAGRVHVVVAVEKS